MGYQFLLYFVFTEVIVPVAGMFTVVIGSDIGINLINILALMLVVLVPLWVVLLS